MVLIQHKDHNEVFHLFHRYSLQVSEVWVSMPELLVHGCQVTEIQAPPCALHVDSYHIQSSELTLLEGLDSSSSLSSSVFSQFPCGTNPHCSTPCPRMNQSVRCQSSYVMSGDCSLELLFWWGLNMLPYF